LFYLRRSSYINMELFVTYTLYNYIFDDSGVNTVIKKWVFIVLLYLNKYVSIITCSYFIVIEVKASTYKFLQSKREHTSMN